MTENLSWLVLTNETYTMKENNGYCLEKKYIRLHAWDIVISICSSTDMQFLFHCCRYLRAVAHRLVVRWLCDPLGWENTRPLPACVYHDIRTCYFTRAAMGYSSAQDRENEWDLVFRHYKKKKSVFTIHNLKIKNSIDYIFIFPPQPRCQCPRCLDSRCGDALLLAGHSSGAPSYCLFDCSFLPRPALGDFVPPLKEKKTLITMHI